MLSPIVLATALLLFTPLRQVQVPWSESIIAAAFTTVIPWLVLAIAKYRGSVTDMHVTQRSQRHKIFALTAISILCGLGILAWRSATTTIFVEVFSILAGLLVVAVINVWWKVSVHLAVGTYVALHLAQDFSWLTPIVLFLALLSWSRIRSFQHTASQVCGGIFVGVMVSYLSDLLGQLT